MIVYNKNHRVTYVLAGLTTLVWLIQVIRFGGYATSGLALEQMGALWGWDIVLNPLQAYRFVTALFVHIGWQHYLMNMVMLVFVGRQIEELWGSKPYLTLYLGSGIFGNILTFGLKPESLSAGASTALFGVFASVATLGYLTRQPQLEAIGKTFFALIVVNLVMNLFSSGVNMVGHVGGAIGGVLMTFVIGLAFDKRNRQVNNKMALFVYLISSVFLILIGFIRLQG